MGDVATPARRRVRVDDRGRVGPSDRGDATVFPRGRSRILRRTSRQVLGARSRAGKYNSEGIEGPKTGAKPSPKERLRLPH